ncbi:hypothetical protein [Microcoleus sp. MON2_D5]|uniref:hypothetical protein n=1 Tax=Microcoleus sp. MON2_D5 TaxID=2818833 RepID=UPI002FD69CA4
MPNAYGRAFTTANFLSNLATLKAINFGASDPMGCWFVVPNQTTNNVEIWVWEPASTATTNEIDVVRPDSVVPGSPGRCVQRLKFDASSLGGILGAIAALNTAGLIERTADGSASVVGLGNFARTFLGSASDSDARTTLNLGNVTNTSDANKPVSTAQQNALNQKADLTALNSKADLVGGFVPTSQLPSFVDDVLEFAALVNFPATGEIGKIYLATGTNIVYRWSGSVYVEVSASLALGTTSATAYRGDFGNAAYTHSQTTGNPHGTTATQIGLPNLTNHLQVNTTENQTVGGEKTFTGVVRITNTNQSTSTTTGALIVVGGGAFGGNQYIGGFTLLGDNVAIKQKQISGTTGTAGTDVFVAHEITGTIRGVTCIVTDIANRLMSPGMTLASAQNEYYVYTTSTQFIVYVPPTNSSNVVSRPFTALITYSA